MATSRGVATALLGVPELAELLGVHHRIMANDWQATDMSSPAGTMVEWAVELLERIDWSPAALRRDLGTDKVAPRRLYSETQMVARAADLLGDSAGLVHENERGWREARVKLARLALGAAGIATGAATLYLSFGREPCLTWGATDEEVRREMPGDGLLANPEILATRAVTIDTPPTAIWPWLMQMGSGRGGVYTYDWIENLLGLDMHSIDEIRPELQNRKVGDAERLGKSGPVLRVAVLEPESAMVLFSDDGNWVWAFGLYPIDQTRTRLVSRNRISSPGASLLRRVIQMLVMEPGSLIMERKMLLGIKERAEMLAKSSRPSDAPDRETLSLRANSCF